MAEIDGYRKLSRQLTAMQGAVASKVLRNAANQAMLPVVKQARQNIPVGNPPYESSRSDPYPVKGLGGKLRTPGFAKRNIARKAIELRKGGVLAMVGVKPEAFYAVQFIELGKSNAPAQPWLKPALKQAQGSVDQRFRERLRRLIDRAISR